jgi:hypothetical protein
MMRNLFYVLIAMAIAGLTGMHAAAAAPQTSGNGATFRPLDHDDDNGTVCCARGGQRWWSDANRCYQAGGQPTRNDYCRQSGGYDGNGDYGYGNGYAGDPYGNPDRRVCCNSRYGIGWASWRQCRYAQGQDVMNKICRKHKYGVDYNRIFGGYNNGYGYGQDPYNNLDRRVCCKRGWRDWWSTFRECRRAGGYETANRECRRD